MAEYGLFIGVGVLIGLISGFKVYPPVDVCIIFGSITLDPPFVGIPGSIMLKVGQDGELLDEVKIFAGISSTLWAGIGLSSS